MHERLTRRQFFAHTLAPLAVFYLIREAPEQPREVPEPPREVPEQPRGGEGQPFDILMNYLIAEADRRRAERQKKDPEYSYAVDRQLNQDRYNFVLYGYGDTHEPPRSERVEIGSFTILSYDRRRKVFTKTSLTHDIWAPEIYRYLAARGIPHDSSPIKIHRAFHDGGFDLMGQVIEHATGLCADFRIALRDEAIARGIDTVLEYITVDVPYDLDVLPYYLDGKKLGQDYPDNHFQKGRQRFSGARAIQFIKAIPIEPAGTYNKAFEHRVRETYVFQALRASIRDNFRNPLFLPRLLVFWQQEEGKGTAQADFDVKALLANNLKLVTDVTGSIVRNGLSSVKMPEIVKEIYIVDARSGDGGVQWASINGALFNPIIRKHIQSGRIPNGGMDLEVPLSDNADPDAEDLVKDYWPAVRRRVRQLLLS